MDRITGKKLPPPLVTPADDARAPRQPEQVAPPAGRLMAGSESMTPAQREQNRQLIALYHAMRNVGPAVGAAELTNSTIKGWTRRRQAAVRARNGSRSARAERTDGNDAEYGDQKDSKR